MLRRDTGKEEATGSDIEAVESENLVLARRYLQDARNLQAELDTIRVATAEPDANLDSLEAATSDVCQALLAHNDKILALKEKNIAETLAILEQASTATAAATNYSYELIDNIQQQKVEDDLPPPLPPAPTVDEDEDEDEVIVEDENNYFFAHTEAEYTARANIVAPVAANLEGFAAYTQKLLLQANGLSVNATTENIRQAVRQNIDKQITLAKQYKAFLSDEICRFENEHFNSKTGATRADDFRDPPATAAGATREDAVRERNQKIMRLEAILAVLARAKASAALPTANAPVENVFYSRMNEQEVFADANEAVNMQTATQAAMNYLGRQLQLLQAGAPERLHAAFGAEPKATVANHKVRFIGTEVVVTPGKLTIPVAMVQKTNEKKTYSEQTFHLAPGHLSKLDALPFYMSATAKMEKIKEQMRFISHAFETSLASITTNGPIEIRNWEKNMSNAAAVYCYVMGYELSPNTALEELKKTPQKLETLVHAFKQQIAEDPVFAKHIDEAIARRDAKIAAEHTSSPRPD